MPSLRIKRSTALKAYLTMVAALPRLDEAAQAALQGRFLDGDDSAMQAMVESFLPGVVAQACALRGKGLSFEALIAAGNRGLSEALVQSPTLSPAGVRIGIENRLNAALARA